MAKKGFTLIELLIVIGILAILASATVLVLNPAQILQESRDTQRLNDINNVTKAISLYTVTATPTFGGNWRCTVPSVVGTTCAGAVSNQIRLTDGTGWVDINIGTNSGLTILPMDPNGTQTNALHYSFKSNNAGTKTFEVTAQMESAKYSNGGTAGKENNDGGNNLDCYERGNDLTLIGAAEC